MLAVARHRIGDVGCLVAVGSEVVGLRHFRPAEPGVGKVARRGAVHAPHFLQEDEVGVERLDAQHQVVDLEPLPRADPAHALVDVVRGDAQHVARVLRTVEGAVDGAHRVPTTLFPELVFVSTVGEAHRRKYIIACYSSVYATQT